MLACYDHFFGTFRGTMDNALGSPRLRLVIRGLSTAASIVALPAIAGHLVHDTGLIALRPEWQGMSLLTAIGVLILAAPLWQRRPGGLAGWQLAACWLLMTSVLGVLGSHFLFNADIISPWISSSLLQLPLEVSGRVSVATAAGLLVLAAATLMSRSAHELAKDVVEVAANMALLIAGVALLGYAYRISDLYGLYVFDTMSLQSAFAIACLALARLIAEPESRLGMALRSSGLSARQLRRMLLLTALPAVLGWLLVRIEHPGTYGNSASIALLVIVTSVPMFYLLLENARTVELLDRGHRRQHESERRMADDLRSKIDEQTAHLAESHRLKVEALALAERNKRFSLIAQLTGGTAHDFNNLLMVIGGNAQLLRLHLRDNGVAKPYLDKITDTVKGAARLTARLSAFSDTQRLDIAPFHLDTVVRAAIAETGPQRGNHIQLSSSFGAGDSTVLGDGIQLQLAIVHLICNACEAMAEGGRLSISTNLHALPEGRQGVTIRIADNGPGMTDDVLRRAGEPFFTTKNAQHYGLGLAQAHSVMHQASGSLQLSSQVGFGTSVELSLPCISIRSKTRVTELPRSSNPTVSSRRLLLVDDNDDVRAVTALLLRALGYEVIEAGSGKEGLQLLQQYEPALAIIDYLMPGMSGAEVAHHARQHMPGLPIIFISGYADSNAIDAIAHSRLLRKPVEADELARAVAAALEEARPVPTIGF